MRKVLFRVGDARGKRQHGDQRHSRGHGDQSRVRQRRWRSQRQLTEPHHREWRHRHGAVRDDPGCPRVQVGRLLSSQCHPLSETFDTAQYNVGIVWNASASTRLTAPVTVRYLVTATVAWNNATAGVRRLQLLLNGVILTGDVAPGDGDGVGGSQWQTVQTVLRLNAGDYMQVETYQNSGSALAEYTWTSGGRHIAPVFAMEWLAPQGID